MSRYHWYDPAAAVDLAAGSAAQQVAGYIQAAFFDTWTPDATTYPDVATALKAIDWTARGGMQTPEQWEGEPVVSGVGPIDGIAFAPNAGNAASPILPFPGIYTIDFSVRINFVDPVTGPDWVSVGLSLGANNLVTSLPTASLIDTGGVQITLNGSVTLTPMVSASDAASPKPTVLLRGDDSLNGSAPVSSAELNASILRIR